MPSPEAQIARLPKPAEGIKTVGVESKDLAIVVLSYNHPELTARSVRAARLAFRGEIILVHNGSLSAHIERLRAELPDVRHLALAKNRGYSGGANHGFAEAFREFEWVIFLTNDAEILNLPNFPKNPSVLIPKIYIRKTKRIDSLGGGFDPTTARLRHMRDETPLRNRWRIYVPGTAFALHREVWRRCGGFEEALGTYWEDVDWSQRVQAQGFPIALNAQWEIAHGGGKTCRKDSAYTIYYFQRNRARVSWRYAPAKYKPLLAACLFISWIRLSYRLLKYGRRSDFLLLLRAALQK